MYRIALKYFSDIRKFNFPTKIDMIIRLTLETGMKKLLKSKKNVTNIGAPDKQIVFLKASFLQDKQILLTIKNFWQYRETILISSKLLRMGIQKTLHQKNF